MICILFLDVIKTFQKGVRDSQQRKRLLTFDKKYLFT